MKKSYNLEYNKTKECEILIFGDDLNFEHFSRWNIESIKNLHTFKKSYLFNNDFFSLKWCNGEHLNIFYSKLQKKSFKNSFACKNVFWEKNLQSFSKVIPLAPSYKFWPIPILASLKDHSHLMSNLW
jgi:hypothetical protein